jgi:CubicO group peptidase (beta-lactamase class C family)
LLRERLNAIYQAHQSGYSGATLVTQGREALLLEAAGFACRDFGVANTVDTRFDTASVTKVFTAVAVLQLAEQNKLSLSDYIHDIIDLTGTEVPADVRVEHLLNHTSGIADDADEEAGEDYAALFVEKPNYRIRNNADFLPNFAYKKPLFKAGTDVRYNNCAFVLLGLAVERLSGMSYRSYAAERVFKPAGMSRTYFGAMDEARPDTAEGYFAVTGGDGSATWKKNIYSYPPIGTADSGALTTVRDLDRFMRAIQSGVLLSREYADMILTPHCMFARPKKPGVWRSGYGFEFIEAGGEVFCVYKEGENAGVQAMCSYYPGLDLGVYLLANQDVGLWGIVREIREAVWRLIVEQ